MQFEEAFNEALVTGGGPEEAAGLLWKAARRQEPWAIQELCRRFVPTTDSMRMIHEVNENETIDYAKLSDKQLEQLEAILAQSCGQLDSAAGGKGPAQSVPVRGAGVALCWNQTRHSSTVCPYGPFASTCRPSPKAAFGNLIINVPPGHAKSLLTAVFWPAWIWIDHPESRFLFTSYREPLAIRDSVRCRRLIESDFYQARWGRR